MMYYPNISLKFQISWHHWLIVVIDILIGMSKPDRVRLDLSHLGSVWYIPIRNSQGALLVPLQLYVLFLIVTWAGCFQCFPQVFSLTKTIATLKLWEIIDLKREQISVGSQISSSGSGSIFYLFKWNLIDASKWNVQGFCLGKVCVT